MPKDVKRGKSSNKAGKKRGGFKRTTKQDSKRFKSVRTRPGRTQPKWKRGSKSGGKQNATSLRKKLIRALAAPDYYVIELGDQAISPASSATLGIQCTYFSFNAGQPYGTGSPIIHKLIAQVITSTANQDIAYEECSFKCVHAITSMTPYDVMIEGWLLECRRDLPMVTKYTNTISAQLQQAFINSGIAANATNVSTSPFQANPFLLDYKVVRHVNKKLKPGGTCSFVTSSKKTKMIRPNQFVYMTAGLTYATGSQTLDSRRGERYWLFRVYSKSLGDNSSTPSQLMDVGAKVNMLTKIVYEYKYVQDINSITNTTVGGITTQSGNVNVVNSTSGVNEIEALY